MITANEKLAREEESWDGFDEVAEEESGTSRGGRGSFFWLQTIAFLFGLALLVYVIRRVGIQPIFDALSRVGFGFLILIAISGLRHFLRALAMRLAVPPEHRRFNYLQAFTARLGGEAISFLTFTGPLLGEATKVALLKKRVPLAHGVPALVVDNIIYNLSVVIFILTGACVMLVSYDLPMIVRYALFAIAATAGLGIVAAVAAVTHRVMLLTWLIERLESIGIKSHTVSSKREQVARIENKVYDFYKHHPVAFFAMFAFDFICHATSVLEVYLTLKMLGFVPRVRAAYIIESLTKVINFVFGFVPGTIGVYESGNMLILRTLAYTKAAGLALALVRKAGMVFWTVVGLIILMWRAVPNASRRVIERSPRLQKLMDSLVLSNIAHRPARTAVSVLGIAIGVLLIVFTVGLAHGVLRERGRRESNLHAEIMIRASGTLGLTGSQPFSLPLSRVREIAQIEGVRLAIPLGQSVDKSDSGFGSRLIDGINFDEYAAISGMTIIEGRKLQGGNEAIVDSNWQKQRHATVGSTVELYERPFTIVGVYDPPSGGRIKIPLDTMQEQLGSEGFCSTVLVSCTDPAQQEAVAERIRQKFPEDQILFTRDLPELYTTAVPALNVFIKVVVAIASSISLLVILLAMYTTVTERTRQIGILKSLGMSNANIAWVIEQEAIFVSILGVVVGILLTLGARFAVMRMTSLSVEIEPQWLLVALGVGLIGGTIGALYPALRAARQDAVDALSYE